MSSNVTIKALGLVTSPNALEVAPGSLTQAQDCIIRRDNVIESRRGYKLYGNSFTTASDRAKQLLFYKTRILRHVFDNTLAANKLQYDSDGNGNFQAFAGTYNEPQAGLRIKSIESNGNFYFTTDQGIKKISAKNPTDLSTVSGYITPAGGIKAIDVTATIKYNPGSITGVLPQDSAVAYRVVWGKRDANNNLVLGAPSQRALVYNYLINLLLLDYTSILNSLDAIASNSLINNGNYVNTFKLPSNASAASLYTYLQNLTTTLDNNILYAKDSVGTQPLQISTAPAPVATISSGVCTVTFSVGNPQNYFSLGSRIRLGGFAPTSGTLNGAQQITLTTPTTIQFNTTAVGPITLSSATINSYEYEARAPSATAIPLQVGSPYPFPATPATDNDLVNLQGTLQSIITRLQNEPNATITTSASAAYIAILSITTSSTVLVNFTIPQDITTSDFYQIYRSNIVQATGTTVLTNLVPADEMKLVYEAFVTSANLVTRLITIEDITPATFAGAFLYSNQVSGEGALQTNDVPPFALDINKFKNTIFYANTKTRQRKLLSLLGVVNMVANYNASNQPKITIADGNKTNTYKFVIGIQQVTQVTTVAGSALAASGPGSYFIINNANNVTSYYVWYKIGTSSDPIIANKIGIQVNALVGDSANIIANKTRDSIAQKLFDFTTSASTNIVTITNNAVGYTSNPAIVTSGFTIVVTTSGSGERASTKEVLLSTNISPSQAVDDTARSLIRVVNQNINEDVYLYYLSSTSGIPGQFFLESRNLNFSTFYIVADNSLTGQSFSPDLSPDLSITSISTALNAVITTSVPHLLQNGAQVIIANSNSTPLTDGFYTITYVSPTQFSIPFTTTGSGTSGSIKVATSAVQSSNDNLPNRIYYSKLNQPEAVPIVNTIDVGAKDKAILRIFPLRDSLFIFKEDGLFRISGEVAPFTLALFDASAILLAPDSISLADNLIYGWTTQGISSISESGVRTVSRPIDSDILKLASNNYPNFKQITWGVGYESDNSYTVYTNKATNDTVATIGYRYSNLTNTWTNVNKTATCGIINPIDDRMYLGAGDISYIEQERKTFTRLDYADRELASNIVLNSYLGATISLPNITNFVPGDAFVQDQLLTIYTFNALLEKLDIDTSLANAKITSITTGLTPLVTTLVTHNLNAGDLVKILNSNTTPSTDGLFKVISVPTSTSFTFTALTPILLAGTSGIARYSYYSNLLAKGGNDLSIKVSALAQKLDNDPSTLNKTYFNLVKPFSGTLTANTIANPTVITSASHGLVNGRVITITGSNSNPLINGTYTITRIDDNTFSIPISVNLTAGTTGTYFTITNSFQDILAGFNAIIGNLNIDNGVSFKNYSISSGTIELEAIIISVNQQAKTITLNAPLDFIVGPVTIFKAINMEFTYAPYTMGDPLSLKHFSESTVMFENKAFTNCTYSFASDLNPSFTPVLFKGDGSGIFGSGQFGGGFFGGASSSIPFRTYVPRVCQRSRFLTLKFNHTVAREKISIFGITVTGNLTSIRGFR